MKQFYAMNWKTISAITIFAAAASLVGCNPNRNSETSETATTTKEDATSRDGSSRSGTSPQQPGTAPSQQPGTAASPNMSY